MKIIELLNKIANGEEVPKKIKWGEFELEWEELGYHDYKFLGTGNHLLFQGFATSVLNDEVEIIEEKKIPEKLDIKIQNETTGNAYITNEQGTKCYLTKHSKIIAERLNQVIDYLQSKGE